MMIEVFKDYEQLSFVRLAGQNKNPIKRAWQDNPETYEQAVEHNKKGLNYGVMGGYGGLIIIDVDRPTSTKDKNIKFPERNDEMYNHIKKCLPDTLEVLTGSGGKHLYFFCPDIDKKIVLKSNDIHWGEIISQGSQVVGPGSIHPETKKQYKIINDCSIVKVSKDLIMRTLEIFIEKKQTKTKTIIEKKIKKNDSVSIVDVIDVTGMKLTKQGYQGSNVWHGSTGNANMSIDVDNDTWYCHRCESGGSVLQAIAVNERILTCDQCKPGCLTGDKYKDTLKIAKDKYNYKVRYDDDVQQIKNDVLELLADDDNKTKEKSKGEAIDILVNHVIKEFKIKTIMQDTKYVEMWGYCSGIYVPIGQSLIKEELKKILGVGFSKSLSTKIIENVEPLTYIMPNDFFKNDYPYILPVKNGLLYLDTLELKPFDPDVIFFNKLNIEYNPGAECPKIIKHLKDVIKKEGDIDLLQETIGNCLIKKYKYQKSVMMVGSGRNGKGVTLEIIKRLLGADNCTSLTIEQIETQQYALSELYGKLANITGDLSSSALKCTGNFKMATGGDMLSASRKFLSNINFENYAKFFFACNELPIVYDNSRGFWDRWLYFEFPYTFVKKEEYDKLDNKNNYKIMDPSLKDKLFTDDELEGFLIWAIEGMKNLNKNSGFTTSLTFEEIKKQWTKQSDSFLAFCESELVFHQIVQIEKQELRYAYNKYCEDHKLKKLSDKHIINVFSVHYAVESERDRTEKRQPYIWKGVKLK